MMPEGTYLVVPAIEAFERLPSSRKLEALFEGYDPDIELADFPIASEFEVAPVAVWEALQGESLERAAEAFVKASDWSRGNGGGPPDVTAVFREGVVYAYRFETCGRAAGNWGLTEVFSRDFEKIGEFGWSD
jgi:hypothetical protein